MSVNKPPPIITSRRKRTRPSDVLGVETQGLHCQLVDLFYRQEPT